MAEIREIYRVRSEDFTVEENVTVGSNSGVAQVKYYLETVVNHQFANGGSVFGVKVYLNISSVSSPIQLWIGWSSGSMIVNKYNMTKSNGGIPYYNLNEGEGLEIISGQTYEDILIYEFDDLDKSPSQVHKYHIHNFMDGKLPFEFSASLFVVDIATKLSGIGSGYTPLSTEKNKWKFSETINDLIPVLDISTQPVLADNFTDETTNPSISYSIYYPPNSSDSSSTTYQARRSLESGSRYKDYSGYRIEFTTLQIGLSLDGVTLDVPYRDVPVGGNYTFNLTTEELDTLRRKAQGNDSVPIYYMLKTTKKLQYYYNDDYDDEYPPATQTFYSQVKRIFTIVGCNPTLNPTVKDIKSETLALTGNENIFIRYESMAEYAINATASKYATIVSQSVQCGSKVITNLPNGVIDDVESGTFIFNVTDSRNMGASSSVFKQLVEYVKPTCYQKLSMQVSGETGAIATLRVNGSYFNGSFGAVSNTLKLEVRYKQGSGSMGAWQTVNVSPSFNGTEYEITTTFSGLSYEEAYTFQCRITDKLNVVESSQYTIKMLPVFDWSNEDFNFNVPINIEAEDLSMNGKTIIRHSDTTNNTVLSATGGNIYIRPNGTDSTYNQTILYGNGSVNFSGGATFGGGATFNGGVSVGESFSINGNNLADYVIATGEEAMGSNGTWYWRKWASGKAEAWGCRNFGNMAVNTIWGNLYRSAIFTQDLPNNVFIRTPDSININIVHAGYGGWICKHEQTAPSADTTGSFIFVRPASATVTPTNIGFYIVGEWQ